MQFDDMFVEEEPNERGIISIQRMWRKRRYISGNLNIRIRNARNYLFDITENLDENYRIGLLNQDKYIEFNGNLNNLVKIHNSLNAPINPFRASLSYFNTLEHQISLVETFIYDLCMYCGCRNIHNILEILIGLDWSDGYNYSNMMLLQFYNSIFKPISCLVINRKNYNEIKLENVLVKEISNNKQINENLFLNTYGAEICIPHNNKILIITGIIIKDNLNLCKTNNSLGLKLKIQKINRGLEFSDISCDFKKNYLNNISLRDLLLTEHDHIVDMIIDEYNKLSRVKNNDVSDTIKKYINSNMIQKQTMIKLLLLDEQNSKSKYLSDVLSGVINIEKNLTSKDSDIMEIFKSFQWNMQRRFLSVFKKVKKINGTNNDYELAEDVMYENKIKKMDAPEYVKQKGYEKLKKFRNSTDNSGANAATYLDGLLKIPFGVYKEEDIMTFLKKFSGELTSLIKISHNKIMTYINENCHIPRKIKKSEKILDILESVHDNDLETEKSIDDFLLRFNKVLLKNIGITKKVIQDIPTDPQNDLLSSSKTISELMNEMQQKRKKPTGIISNRKSPWERIVNSYKDKKENKISTAIENNIHIKNEILSQINKLTEKNELNEIMSKFKEKYLEWMEYKQNKIDYLKDVKKTLDNAVYGHKEAKKQLERIIGQWINGNTNGVVLGIHGPPGTGKTTLCKKGLARCLKDKDGVPRPFSFIQLGGSSDGSTLEGHSYTYVDSKWGDVVDILMDKECMNPIIYIDELDKVSQTERGREIIGILTHLTDSSQNAEFKDKYFSGIKFDLSKALIVFSYNDSSLVDRILRDRILEIKTNALTKNEKIEIIKNYLMPEITKSVGYGFDDLKISEKTSEYLIDCYTYEGGVRKLKDKLFEIIRELNLERIKGDSKHKFPLTITNKIIDDILDINNKIHHHKIHSKPTVGIMNGLYATESGIGGLTRVECFRTISERKFELELTGKQGDVMVESVKVARTIATNLLPDDIKIKINDEIQVSGSFGLHIHCPEGGVPKDGPSAGGVMTLVILSQLCGIPITNDIAMTGEIDLNGTIRAIGGLHSKLQGAKNAGCSLVIIPKDNEQDLNKIYKEMSFDTMKIVMVSNIYETIPYIFKNNKINFRKYGINVS